LAIDNWGKVGGKRWYEVCDWLNKFNIT
jgi:hypothetical protein